MQSPLRGGAIPSAESPEEEGTLEQERFGSGGLGQAITVQLNQPNLIKSDSFSILVLRLNCPLLKQRTLSGSIIQRSALHHIATDSTLVATMELGLNEAFPPQTDGPIRFLLCQGAAGFYCFCLLHDLQLHTANGALLGVHWALHRVE